MRALRAWVLRFAELFRKQRRDRELEDELESHLLLHVEDNLRRGMTAEEARRQAVLALGGIEQTKEIVRERRGLPLLETLAQDLRYAARTLARNRGFTLVALIVLTCGVGVSIATFSVVNRVLLRRFPFHAPDQLMVLWERTAQEELPTSYLDFLDWSHQNRVFQSMAGFRTDDANLVTEGTIDRARALVVSGNFLTTLGVRPALGRDFTGEDDRPGAPPVVVLTHALWARRFHADPGVLGRMVELNGSPAAVIGVLPDAFEFPSPGDLLTPLSTISDRLRDRGHDTGLFAVARLRPGVTVERAGSEMSALMAALVRAYPEALAGRRVALATLSAFTVGELPRTLWTLMGAVGFVLLIACTNVANLLMSRAASRRREVAIRTALGASRGRVIRQLLTESVMLSLLGGVLGLLLGQVLTRALLRFGPGNIPRFDDVPLDGWILGFALAVSLVTGLMYGLLPALQVSQPDVASSLKDAERGSSAGRQSLGASLVVAEVALALVLLIGGGLMIRTFAMLHRVDPGFDARGLVTLETIVPARRGEGRGARAFLEQLQERLASLPGVRGVALAHGLPYVGTNQVPLKLEGSGERTDGSPIALVYLTSSNYFRVMGLTLVRGHAYEPGPARGAAQTVVIDEVLASRFFPGTHPIGRYLSLDLPSGWPAMEIVGIARHVKDAGLDERAQVQPQLYLSLDQVSDDALPDIVDHMHVIVRAATGPMAVASVVRREVGRLRADVPVFGVQSMESRIAATMTAQRFSVLLLSVFGAVALVLAAVGLYSLMAYHVSQRHREIGIRMALGARAADVFGMILRRSLLLTSIGLVLGVLAALALTRLLSSLLFGVTALDPGTYLGVTLLFTLVALIASLVPATRAASVDPMTALRWE